VNGDQSAAAVLGRKIAQLDRRTDTARRIEHHVPGQLGDLTGPQGRLGGEQDDHPIAEGCRVQSAKTRRSLTSFSESIFVCLPAISSNQVAIICIAKWLLALNSD
jgi:hypothetical protein